MTVSIPESQSSLAPHVRNVKVRFDAFPGLGVPATIKEIGTEADKTTRSYPVRVIMDQPEGNRILPGMAGRASGELSEEVAARMEHEIAPAPESARPTRRFFVSDRPDRFLAEGSRFLGPGLLETVQMVDQSAVPWYDRWAPEPAPAGPVPDAPPPRKDPS